MKKIITTAVIAFFAVGTFAFAQDQQNQEEVVDLTPQKGEETAEAKSEETKAAPPAILTHKVESKKFASLEEEVTVAPLASIFVDGGKYFVLAKGAESNVNYVQLEVEVGKTDGIVVEITNGLAPGDEVIVVALSQIKFPVYAKEELTGGACSSGSCPTGETYGGAACKDGECDLSIKASEFFSDKFHEGYGPGFGPSYGPGPGSGYGPSY